MDHTRTIEQRRRSPYGWVAADGVRRAAGRLAIAAALVLVVAGCDQGSTVSVKNDSDRTYVAQVGDDAFLIVPPKQHVTLAAVGFTGPPVPEIQLLDALCAPVGEPHHDGGTFTITGSGTVTFSFKMSGPPEVTAETSSFCAGGVPEGSPILSPLPSDPGPS